MILYDAHNHLQAAALAKHRAEILAHPPAAGMVVNGTCEEDWAAVAQLAAEHAWIRASYGVHPWEVDGVTDEWRERLAERLDGGGCVGEIGLDRGRTEGEFSAAAEVFRVQMAEAARRALPATIHCVRAWGAMGDVVRESALPAGGFLLHAYSGPVGVVAGLVERGAYFSFSGSFLAVGRERMLVPFRGIPADRLLVETDAPAMPLPPELDCHPISHEGGRVNHPANLEVAYAGLARLRGMPVEELAGIVAANYARLFGA